MRCANYCDPSLRKLMLSAQQIAPRDDEDLVAGDPIIYCGFTEQLGADWSCVSTSYGQLHLCFSGLWDKRKGKQVVLLPSHEKVLNISWMATS